MKDYLLRMAEGFELLEKHYLGGSGSRGYGQVQIVVRDGETEKSMAEYLRARAVELSTVGQGK